MDTATAAALLSVSTAGWAATAGAAAHLRHRIRTDDLTGLPNRETLTHLIRRATRRPGRPARPTGGCVGLLLLDVDRFKAINDTHGHAVGNTVLATLAGRLASVAEPGECPIRLHGDEFALWLGRLSHRDPEQHALRRAGAVAAALGEPVTVGRHRLAVTVSVGAAVLPAAGLSAAALLGKADHAMYQAKRATYRTTHPHPALHLAPALAEDAA